MILLFSINWLFQWNVVERERIGIHQNFKKFPVILPVLREFDPGLFSMGHPPTTSDHNGVSAVIPFFLFLAGLMGASGVGLAAAAAHGTSAAGLDSAAWLLLFHATAILGASSLAQQGLLWRPLGLLAMAGFVAGGALFAGDIAMRAFAGLRLFPMAAPTGGTVLLISWLVLSAAAAVAMAGRGR
jgi:uncharacterized membrane protein YgdD (TMEM256/DUF423 family)